MSKPHMGQIMAECDCNHIACHMRGYCMAARIEALTAERDALAEKLEKLERWQAAAFIAHGNLDLDIEANPEALAELKGQGDE